MVHPDVRSWKVAERLPKAMAWAAGCGDCARLLELHRDVSAQAVAAISEPRGIGRGDAAGLGAWAQKFMAEYEDTARSMRAKSAESFAMLRAQKMRGGAPEFFGDRNGMLIGKVIFAHREAWFLARALSGAGPQAGDFWAWESRNYAGLLELHCALLALLSEAGARWEG